MVNILKDFCVIAVAREKYRLTPPNNTSTDRPTPLVNTAIEIPQVITVDVTRPVVSVLVIVLNCFIFFANIPGTSISLSKYALDFI